MRSLRLNLRAELESPEFMRRFGTGWISGVAALILSSASFLLVVSLRYPELLTLPEARALYDSAWFRYSLHLLLIVSFLFALLNLALRANKILGLTSVVLTVSAVVLGGSRVQAQGELTSGIFLGLDWFVLNVFFTGMLFIPLEQLFSKYPNQGLFRTDWREDLFYFLISSIFIQSLSFLSLAPAQFLVERTTWTAMRSWISSQPLWLQFIEIMICTDFMQYWVHRAFHRIPFLWKFHAVHHSAQAMDWMAGARMHLFEIIILRALTVIPMFLLGFAEAAMHSYILVVYLYSTFIHANLRWNADSIGPFIATPRFHHWHHGIDREAIDVNFAIHFPVLDKLFGTYYLPRSQWPQGYGIKGHPVPAGYTRQFLYPFYRKLRG